MMMTPTTNNPPSSDTTPIIISPSINNDDVYYRTTAAASTGDTNYSPPSKRTTTPTTTENTYSLKSLLLSAKANHTIELLMFFHMIGYTCTTVIVQNLYLDRICRLGHALDDQICKNLTAYEEQEKIVERDASYYTMWRSVVESCVPVLFALFLGPFVDRNGSKLPILFSLFGYTIASLMYCFVSFFPSIPAKYLLVCSVPISLTGGLVAFLMSAFTLVSNRSTVANRSFRIAVLEGCWFLGTLGFLLASKVYKTSGFIPVFLISALCFFVAFLYGFYFINESSTKSSLVLGKRVGQIVKEIFDFRSVKETLATVVKRRSPGKVRGWVILLMITIFLRMLALFGTMQVAYLYTRNKFHWDTAAFSKFTTAVEAICLTGGLITLLLMKTLKIRDPVIGTFSAVGFVLSNLCFAGAQAGWAMYFGAVLQMFSGLITIVMRSMISKCVAKDELAKAFSFVSIGEACMPIIAGLLFNPLYSSTVGTFPGAVFTLSAVIHGAVAINFSYFYFATRDFPFASIQEE